MAERTEGGSDARGREELTTGYDLAPEILEIITTLSKHSGLNDQELGEYCLAEM